MKPPRPAIGTIIAFKKLASAGGAKELVVVAVNYEEKVSGNYNVVFSDGSTIDLCRFNYNLKQGWYQIIGKVPGKLFKLLYQL